jgi:hypothetical protein
MDFQKHYDIFIFIDDFLEKMVDSQLIVFCIAWFYFFLFTSTFLCRHFHSASINNTEQLHCKNQQASRWQEPACLLVFAELISSTLKMEAIYFSETSVETKRTTRRHLPEDDTLHHHCLFQAMLSELQGSAKIAIFRWRSAFFFRKFTGGRRFFSSMMIFQRKFRPLAAIWWAHYWASCSCPNAPMSVFFIWCVGKYAES